MGLDKYKKISEKLKFSWSRYKSQILSLKPKNSILDSIEINQIHNNYDS